MALTRLVTDEEAQEAHAFIRSVLRDEIDVKVKGFGFRLKAAQDIVRHYQTQQRFPVDRIHELAPLPKGSQDVKDYANLTDEELERKVAKISDYPRKSG